MGYCCAHGTAWEVAAPYAPRRIGVYDGYVTVDFGAWHFLCASVSTPPAARSSAGSAAAPAPSCTAESAVTARPSPGGCGCSTPSASR
ncbi:hypothetical protein FMEAI12_2280012 [Parafrankia sp. Ea1.12]|nr:hypothetical protein FMEAI12_2280012 [Parafrankia sp. Ea1.12]